MPSVFVVLTHRYRGTDQRDLAGFVVSVWAANALAVAEATRLRAANAADPDPLVRVEFSVEEHELKHSPATVGSPWR